MTVEVFKAWYDSVYVGDGDTVSSIPQSIYDAGYRDYMTGYTLAYGAYLEGVKFAESEKYKILAMGNNLENVKTMYENATDKNLIDLLVTNGSQLCIEVAKRLQKKL